MVGRGRRGEGRDGKVDLLRAGGDRGEVKGEERKGLNGMA